MYTTHRITLICNIIYKRLYMFGQKQKSGSQIPPAKVRSFHEELCLFSRRNFFHYSCPDTGHAHIIYTLYYNII